MLENMSEIRKLDKRKLPFLRKVKKGKCFTEVRKVNELLKKIESKDVTEDNDLFHVEAALMTKVFEKNKKKVRRNSLSKKENWKVKLKNLTKIGRD